MPTIADLELFKCMTRHLSRFFKSRSSRYSLLLIWTGCLYLSTHIAAKAILASVMLMTHPQITKLLSVPAPPIIELKRLVHQHYLSYSIYIPLDDIVIYDQRRVEQPLISLLQQSCGAGSAYIWVPLKLQLPLLGEKVWEWCLIKA